MPNLVVDAVAKRDARRPFVRLFLSVSEDSTPVRNLLPQEFKVEYVGLAQPLRVADLYQEAYMPGRYVVVLQPPDPGGTSPEGPLGFRVQVTRPGGSVAYTLAYLAPRREDYELLDEISPV